MNHLVSILIILAAAAPAVAADLAAAITAEDGWVHLAYPAREGVRSDHQHVIIDGDEVVIENDCDDGLIHATLRVTDGAVERIDTRSGRPARRREREARDLGEISAAGAATYFFGLADRAGSPEFGEDAIVAAALSDAETWPRLVAIARDRDRHSAVRESAIFWLGMAAGDKVESELTAIVDDDSEEIEIREHAVFALHQSLENDTDRSIDTLGRIARENPHPQIRRSALFWLAQHDDPQVVDLFEAILLD